MDVQVSLSSGQQQARTQWNTHESGAAFDRKKTTFLTIQDLEFIAQRSFCVVAGLGPDDELNGLMVMSQPGFVRTPDQHTCSFSIDSSQHPPRLAQGLQQAVLEGRKVQLALFFISHPTRERLCVHGVAEILTFDSARIRGFSWEQQRQRFFVQLQVEQAFFHCAKYIRTQVPGLTAPETRRSERIKQEHSLLNVREGNVLKEIFAFMSRQVICFLCTINRDGQPAVNHRGGAQGFLVTLQPDAYSPWGTILLPDYAGNGAFEAIGNILETGSASLVVPDYREQVAVCVSGSAQIMAIEAVSPQLAQSCVGAERIIALRVERVEIQYGDWSATLAYERTYAEAVSSMATNADSNACSVCVS